VLVALAQPDTPSVIILTLVVLVLTTNPAMTVMMSLVVVVKQKVASLVVALTPRKTRLLKLLKSVITTRSVSLLQSVSVSVALVATN
jgi:hypothetical protein